MKVSEALRKIAEPSQGLYPATVQSEATWNREAAKQALPIAEQMEKVCEAAIRWQNNVTNGEPLADEIKKLIKQLQEHNHEDKS